MCCNEWVLQIFGGDVALDQQIEKARKEIAPDGYDMSVGEILNLYRDNELIIHPEYQRLFRWKDIQKTRFIESLLLGIPVPPIFVFQTSRGAWELIDGLQRLSTIFEFAGVLKRREGEAQPQGPVALLGTNFLPDLEGKVWQAADGDEVHAIGATAQLSIKRARIRVEILKKESDPIAKYELFQRLNTGGTELSEQEVRNCTALMINPNFYNWLKDRSTFEPFMTTTAQTEDALKKQAGVELALRFVAFRRCPYEPGLDVHEYLDKSLISLASDKAFPAQEETEVFERTFGLLQTTLGENAFKRWNGDRFVGKFLMSLFEVIAVGISHNINQIESSADAVDFVVSRAKDLWQNEVFQQNSGAGVRGTTRLAKLLPMAKEFFHHA
jgi:hypothetical protein